MAMEMSQRNELLALAFYSAMLLVTLATFTSTFLLYNLFPLQFDNLEWSNAWLLAYVIDYYGACLCFCGVIVATENTWRTAIPWTLGCCTLGSPACCLYLFVWIAKEGGTLRLQRGSMSLGELDSAVAASENFHNKSASLQQPQHYLATMTAGQQQSHRDRDLEQSGFA